MDVQTNVIHAEQLQAKAIKLTGRLMKAIRVIGDKIGAKTHAVQDVANDKRRKAVAVSTIAKAAGAGYHAVRILRSNVEPSLNFSSRRAKSPAKRRRAIVPIVMGATLTLLLLRRHRMVRVPRFLINH